MMFSRYPTHKGIRMKKLFEIPIYALSPAKLDISVGKRITKLKELFTHSDADTIAHVIDSETYPMRCWDYNHIIGYIRIAISKTDGLMAYGRYSGVETVEIDGTSYTIPCVDAYHANYAYQYRAFIINDRFDYSAIKPVAQAIFGKDIEIREAEAEDFSEDTAMSYERTLGYYPFFLVELENQSNANFTKFLFSTQDGKIVDAKDPPFDGVFERS